MKTIHLAATAALAVMAQGTFEARAEISIATVYVGDVGNAADPSTGSLYGSVAYGYNIGKYEVTIGQYTEFLNSVAATDPYELYNTNMGTDPDVAGIARSGSSGSYTYSVMNSSAHHPITNVNWYDAARFSNWMANGQPVGAQGNATTEYGSYTLNGAMSGIILKNPGATWFIPSEDEWYKAAYYDPAKGGSNYWLYPTRSDSAPGKVIGSGANQANFDWAAGAAPYITNVGAYSGSCSHYGTFDQGGNVFEWNDAVLYDSFRGLRGGCWDSSDNALQSSNTSFLIPPAGELSTVGFRLASVPEPTAAVLMFLSGAGWLVWKRRRTAA